ncbi:conjugative transposon protein TraJ [Arachidicoccus terrestris]|uniref:conjugative transposon protein TraJ n=1 Tax=Arachidicoccus terrestris TaxID=2875539 RepID=UPI001CC75B92|nr:conjugative transposon protein TraJ [Arachidicoccus terrestris]
MVLGIAVPNLLLAQDGSSSLAGDIQGLHAVLDQLYNKMMPMCSQLIGVGRAIAAFAALWYIAQRVWRHIASAESVDFYPLLRPFVIGFAILVFPAVIAMINGVLKPTVTGTAGMVTGSDAAVAALLKQKEEAVKQTDAWQMYVGQAGDGDRDRWYQYTHPGEEPASEGMFEGIGNDIRFAMAKASYNFRNSVKEWMSEVLQVLFAAASLCINTIRTFNLIILAILGPLVFGLGVFDGFQHTIRHWLARYINVFLWLPVANIFGAVIGKIQENMLRIDLAQVQSSGDTFFSSTDMGYLIFMIIGIIGYFTVPSIAGHIMHVGGGDAIGSKATALAGGIAGGAVAGAMTGGAAGISVAGTAARNIAGATGHFDSGYHQGSSGGGVAAKAGRAYGRATHYMKNKLNGNP